MFKIGDKAETPLGIGIFQTYSTFSKTSYIQLDKSEIRIDNEKVKPYKSAHDKLIELGFTFEISELETFIQYTHERRDMRIIINTIRKEYGVFHFTDFNYRYIDIKLSKILLQRLEELE